MKNKILSIALGLLIMAIGTTTYAGDKTPGTKLTATEKVLKSFNNQFKTSIKPTLHSIMDGFVVQLTDENREITSTYDRKGNWVYTIQRYPHESLSKDIIDIVNSNYECKGSFISTMEKVDQPGNETVYVVYIEGRDSFKTVRVVNNEVELISNFQKG